MNHLISKSFDTSKNTTHIENCQCEKFLLSSFNQDISGWDVGNATDMSFMFYGASSFNQDISGWDVGNVTDM
ncbi:MAG: BspA family leucine-rich repeat surface protein, partial [Sphaerochaetaceae bacterium]|nr:BspA family leucine-rich repeat surface protein [Sphaerochaetaceae bacterium]